MKPFTYLLLLSTMLAVAVACQTPAGGDTQVVVEEVEVTREVVVTQFATVQVPVEVTREVFVSVEADVTPEPTDVPEAAVGSAENPLRLVFSPYYEASVVELRGQAVADELAAATELFYEVVIARDYAESLELVCQSAENTVAILTSLEYVLAEQQCGLQIGYAGIRDGISWVSSMIVFTDPAINSIEDLEGRTWGVGDTEDFNNYLWFQALFEAEGIETGDVVTYGTDASVVTAALDEEVDFITGTYLPPILPFDEEQWVFGQDDPELWRRTGQLPFRSGIGFVVVLGYVENGGYRVRDARSIVLDSRTEVFIETDILRLSDQMPNDAIAFGATMPIGLSREIGAALEAYTVGEDCPAGLCSDDFFNWEGVTPVRTEFYDSVRFVIEQLALTETDVFTYLNR